MKLVIAEPLSISDALLTSLTAPLRSRGWDVECHVSRPADQDELGRRLAGADAAVIANYPCTGEALSAADRLQFLCIAFTGVDHVDIPWCRSHHITVSNCAGYSTEAVAELVMAMALSLYRDLGEAGGALCTGPRRMAPGIELSGKCFGVIGTGRIGQRTALLAQAFGCHVLGWNRSENAPFIEYAPLETLLRTCDILSLHLPLTDDTRGLIGERELALMKPTALLINTARGPIVDSAALAAALKAHRLGGAGIDVYDTEPPLPQDHPLLDAPHCLLTPHIGFFSAEAMERRARLVFDNLEAWAGGAPINRIC